MYEFFSNKTNIYKKNIMSNFKNIKYNVIIESISPKIQLDEIDELENTIQANLDKNVTIPKDVINSFKIKDSLNPEIWENDKLTPNVKENLIKIAYDFFKEIEVPSNVKIKDIIFTGSLANFNWSKFSDVDLHIVIDFNDVDANTKMVEDFFYAQKVIWNQNHDITIFKYPIELYVQDINHKLVATAVYSVINDTWIKKPIRENFKLDKKTVLIKAQNIIKQLKTIRDNYKHGEYQEVVKDVKHLKDKIKQMRNAGLEKGGELSLENITFKILRRTDFMDILDSFKAKSYDKLMSINENDFKNVIRQKLHEARERIIPYNDKQEIKQHSYSSLSKGPTPAQIDDVKYKMVKAAKTSAQYRQSYDDNYFSIPTIGNGFYQLEIKHDGRLIVKQIKASGDMNQQQGPMTDVGTCKTFQNIARYCTVKAGKTPSPQFPNGAYGKSPADDAANKALVIFQKEILDFLVGSDYTSDSEKASEISAQNMSDKAARTKEKKDLEHKLGGPISDDEWNQYRKDGTIPKQRPKKPTIGFDQAELDKREAERQKTLDRIAKNQARRNK
jgi:hypothetical protein